MSSKSFPVPADVRYCYFKSDRPVLNSHISVAGHVYPVNHETIVNSSLDIKSDHPDCIDVTDILSNALACQEAIHAKNARIEELERTVRRQQQLLIKAAHIEEERDHLIDREKSLIQQIHTLSQTANQPLV